jgi:hypothetical protein
MNPTILRGQLSARPLSAVERTSRLKQAREDLTRLLNERVNPPTPLTLADVHIRALRVVSDQVNDHGGRFPREEHEHLRDLLVDSPVMIGHDHATLPIARNFAARLVDEGERQWVEAWFYWLRGEGESHDQLAADIDGGVVKEGSIGFEFRLPQCSICRQDIRTCEHIPGLDYAVADGSVRTAHYEYREIVRVLETSLVYRGATPETHIVKYPLFDKAAAAGELSLTPGSTLPSPQPSPWKGEGVRISPLPFGPPVPERRKTRKGERVAEGRVRGESSEAIMPALAPRAIHPYRTSTNTLLRVFLATRPHVPFLCPARTVPWPLFVFDYRVGHGPLASGRKRRCGR